MDDERRDDLEDDGLRFQAAQILAGDALLGRDEDMTGRRDARLLQDLVDFGLGQEAPAVLLCLFEDVDGPGPGHLHEPRAAFLPDSKALRLASRTDVPRPRNRVSIVWKRVASLRMRNAAAAPRRTMFWALTVPASLASVSESTTTLRGALRTASRTLPISG